MESEREKTIGAEGLPTAVFTDGHWGGATTVVINKSLVTIFEIGCDGF